MQKYQKKEYQTKLFIQKRKKRNIIYQPKMIKTENHALFVSVEIM